MVSQKDQLMKLLDCFREQKNSLRASLQDLDARLSDLKELKMLKEKQLHNMVRSLHISLMCRCHQLSKDLEVLCDAEEKSLKVMKKSLKRLEDKQEYITAFIHKILSTEGQCILRHKMQIKKWAQRVLIQNKRLPDTVLQLSLSLSEDVCHIIKSFGSFKVTRVPLAAKGKYKGSKPKNTPKEADKCLSGLNSSSGDARSVPTTTSIQAATHSMSSRCSQASSDLCEQPQSASSIPVQTTQVLTDTSSHSSSSSSSSHNFAPPQTTQSNTAQDGVVSLQPSQSQQVFRSLSDHFQSASLLQSSPFVPHQTVVKIIPSNPPQLINPGIVMPQVVLPQSQSRVVLAAVPSDLASSPSVSRPSVSVHTESLPSLYMNSLINTKSQFRASKQAVPSFLTLAPSAQSSQATYNTHPPTPNSSSSHTQQSISQAASQADSGQSQVAPTNVLHPYSQAVSNAQAVNLQPSQSASTESNHFQFTLLNLPNITPSVHSGTAWKFHQYTPILTVNNPLTCIPLVTQKSSQHASGDASCPQAPKLNVLPVSSDKELDAPVSNTPQHPAAPIPSVHSNTGQVECATQTIQMPTCDLPVKALADSVCEGDMSICSSASPVADSNLPSSTVPEKDTKAKELPAVHQLGGPLFTTSVKDCPPYQSFLTRSESSLKSISTRRSAGISSTPNWLIGLPSSIKEILCQDKKVPAEEICSTSALELASLPNAKQNSDETDDADLQLVEEMDELAEKPMLEPERKKTLLVSLLRLPISGSSLSQFQIVPSSQKSEILLQETDENQHMCAFLDLLDLVSPFGESVCSDEAAVSSVKVPSLVLPPSKSILRCLRISAPPATATASPSQSCSSDSSLQADILDCVVCLSAGASLQCGECARSFHTSCHVPPIIFEPVAMMWVCSLCQDVLDDTDPFSYSRLKEPYLSLSDQRRCEQLLLTLMCENNSYLLYKTVKQSAGCVEFSLIAERLLGKCSPPYRSAAEMVSDLWALFDNLSNSKKKDLAAKLQTSYQQQLHVLFGESLHASLLRPLSSGDQTGAPETDGQMAKTTLKRMRKFLAAKCLIVAKKAHTGDT